MTHIHGCYLFTSIHAAFCQAQQEQKKRILEQQKLMAEKKKEDSPNPSDDVSWEMWIQKTSFGGLLVSGDSVYMVERRKGTTQVWLLQIVFNYMGWKALGMN